MGFEQNRGFCDILGEIATAPTGASQWVTAQIGATGFFINWLQSGQDDFFQHKAQIDHRFGKGWNLADLHVHYVLSQVPAVGQTVIINWSYVIVPIGQPIPVIGSWTSGIATLVFTGAETANTHYVRSFATNIPPPANQTYSGVLFFKALRNSTGAGADTYPGNFGLLFVDAHGLVDRAGSLNSFSD